MWDDRMGTTYFDSPSAKHTEKSLEIARDYAQKNGINSIVIASTTGFTAEKAIEIFKDTKMNIIIVTHVTGFLKPDHQQFPEKLRDRLESNGIKVLTTAHGFGGINRIVESSPGKIIANTLRMFCQGVKVAVEIAVMVADTGMVKTNEDVVSVAGTGRGADTVLVISPANSRNLFDLKIKKILAKPL